MSHSCLSRVRWCDVFVRHDVVLMCSICFIKVSCLTIDYLFNTEFQWNNQYDPEVMSAAQASGVTVGFNSSENMAFYVMLLIKVKSTLLEHAWPCLTVKYWPTDIQTEIWVFIYLKILLCDFMWLHMVSLQPGLI